jgi:cytoskeletal protein CcmA (bactofilin family)
MAVFKRFETSRQESFSRPEVSSHSKQSLLGKTLVIKGRVRASEEMVVEGKIDGHITSNSRVVIGKSGMIKADIEASEIVIQGRVDGNVKATAKVEIFPEGILNGNIISQRVVLAEGAVFKGNIDMSLKEEKKLPSQAAPVKAVKDKKDDVKK